MSPFSWQGHNLYKMSLAFIMDWRVVGEVARAQTSQEKVKFDPIVETGATQLVKTLTKVVLIGSVPERAWVVEGY